MCISSRKSIDIHYFFIETVKFRWFAIIYDFTAHWAMKNEQMATIWKFDSKPKSYSYLGGNPGKEGKIGKIGKEAKFCRNISDFTISYIIKY